MKFVAKATNSEDLNAMHWRLGKYPPLRGKNIPWIEPEVDASLSHRIRNSNEATANHLIK